MYNRGVEKRDVFQTQGEYLRFVHHLYELNDVAHARNLAYHLNKPTVLSEVAKPRATLVNVLAFTLMPNHFHLLLQEKEEAGIPRFMQKLGTGYTMFFNTKNKRTGSLFQGKFKAVHVSSDVQLRHLIHYIHLNPVPLLHSPQSAEDTLNSLQGYKWSSLPDYLGVRGFPSVTERNDMLRLFGGTPGYKKSIAQALLDKKTDKTLDVEVCIDKAVPHI